MLNSQARGSVAKTPRTNDSSCSSGAYSAVAAATMPRKFPSFELIVAVAVLKQASMDATDPTAPKSTDG